MRWRPHAADPADHDAAELIDATDRRARIVYRRRDRTQCDIDDLDNAELDVLLQRAGRADIDGATQPRDQVVGQPIRPRHQQQRDAGRNEMTDAALHAYADAMAAREIDQAPHVDEPYIAGYLTDD